MIYLISKVLTRCKLFNRPVYLMAISDSFDVWFSENDSEYRNHSILNGTKVGTIADYKIGPDGNCVRAYARYCDVYGSATPTMVKLAKQLLLMDTIDKGVMSAVHNSLPTDYPKYSIKRLPDGSLFVEQERNLINDIFQIEKGQIAQDARREREERKVKERQALLKQIPETKPTETQFIEAIRVNLPTGDTFYLNDKLASSFLNEIVKSRRCIDGVDDLMTPHQYADVIAHYQVQTLSCKSGQEFKIIGLIRVITEHFSRTKWDKFWYDDVRDGMLVVRVQVNNDRIY